MDNGKILTLLPKKSRSAQEVANLGNAAALRRGKTAGLWIGLLGCHLVPDLRISGYNFHTSGGMCRGVKRGGYS